MRISDWSSDVCSSDLHIGVKRRIGRKAVEAAAPHIEKLVDQHVTYGAQFTRITRLTQDTRYRVAAAIAKGREIDLHKRNPIEVRQTFPHVLAWFDADSSRVGLALKGLQRDSGFLCGLDRKSTRLNSIH